MRTSTAVVVGRFQVAELSEAHKELLSEVGRLHDDRVIVFIGISAIGQPTKNNPLDYETRRRMVQAHFPTYSIAPIVDQKTDELWSTKLDEAIRAQVQFGKVFLYGGRDSFAPHYKGQYEVKTIDFKSSITISGTAIRQTISDHVLETADFRAGVIYALENSYTRIMPTVDIAIMAEALDTTVNKEVQFVLLGKRGFEQGYRFIGGHAEIQGSLEENAIREAQEEARITPYNLTYVGSKTVDDWRYKGTPEKIKTTFFIGWLKNEDKHLACAGDDIDEVKWFSLRDLPNINVEIEHHFLRDMLLEHFNKLKS